MSINLDSNQQYFLSFEAGKYKGGKFLVVKNQQIMLGRSSDLDIVLLEDLVSRKHAEIRSTSDAIYIEDLGSTNGTYINGERVEKVFINVNDRIMIGTNILVLRQDEDGSKGVESDYKSFETSGETHHGSLEELNLVDILRIHRLQRKTGKLAIQTSDLSVTIDLLLGKVDQIKSEPQVGGSLVEQLAFLFTLNDGRFEFELSSDPAGVEVEDEESERVLKDAYEIFKEKYMEISEEESEEINLDSGELDIESEEILLEEESDILDIEDAESEELELEEVSEVSIELEGDTDEDIIIDDEISFSSATSELAEEALEDTLDPSLSYSIPLPLESDLAALSEFELKTFQAVYNLGDIDEVIESLDAEKPEIIKTITSLLERNYIEGL